MNIQSISHHKYLKISIIKKLTIIYLLKENSNMNKMKKLTKPLTLFLAVLTIVSCFSITASAASKSAS